MRWVMGEECGKIAAFQTQTRKFLQSIRMPEKLNGLLWYTHSQAKQTLTGKFNIEEKPLLTCVLCNKILRDSNKRLLSWNEF